MHERLSFASILEVEKAENRLKDLHSRYRRTFISSHQFSSSIRQWQFGRCTIERDSWIGMCVPVGGTRFDRILGWTLSSLIAAPACR